MKSLVHMWFLWCVSLYQAKVGPCIGGVMSCVNFPIVLSLYSAFPYIILIDFSHLHWMTSQWPIICDQQSYSAGKSLWHLLEPLQTLTPMLSKRWCYSSTIIHHSSIRLLSSKATILHPCAGLVPDMTWVFHHGNTWVRDENGE